MSTVCVSCKRARRFVSRHASTERVSLLCPTHTHTHSLSLSLNSRRRKFHFHSPLSSCIIVRFVSSLTLSLQERATLPFTLTSLSRSLVRRSSVLTSAPATQLTKRRCSLLFSPEAGLFAPSLTRTLTRTRAPTFTLSLSLSHH